MAGSSVESQRSNNGAGNGSPGSAAPDNNFDIDLETLALEIFQLLKKDLRLERERGGRR